MGRKAKGIRYNAGCIFRKVSQNNQPEIPPIKAVTSDPISGILKTVSRMRDIKSLAPYLLKYAEYIGGIE